MRILSLILALVCFGSCGAGEKAKKKEPEKRVVRFVEPDKCEPHAFSDEIVGFKLYYTFRAKDFGGKLPEQFAMFFYGAQPISVETDDKKTYHPIHTYSHGRFEIRDNLSNGPVYLIAYFRDIHTDERWTKTPIKFIGTYLSPERRKVRLFMNECMNTNGVVGCGHLDVRDFTFQVVLAKGNPKNKQIRGSIEAIAKVYGCQVTSWEEREGYNYLWEDEKKKK
jgi:hypothetical protein